MEQNDPGREPTDAELFKRLAAEIRASEIGVGNMDDGERALDAVIARGREYLSGARPMPDAPDESVKFWKDGWHNLDQDNRALTARVADLERENAALRAELEALRSGGSPAGPRPFILTPDGKERKYWAGTKDPGATFPGKEPTDAE